MKLSERLFWSANDWAKQVYINNVTNGLCIYSDLDDYGALKHLRFWYRATYKLRKQGDQHYAFYLITNKERITYGRDRKYHERRLMALCFLHAITDYEERNGEK